MQVWQQMLKQPASCSSFLIAWEAPSQPGVVKANMHRGPRGKPPLSLVRPPFGSAEQPLAATCCACCLPGICLMQVPEPMSGLQAGTTPVSGWGRLLGSPTAEQLRRRMQAAAKHSPRAALPGQASTKQLLKF